MTAYAVRWIRPPGYAHAEALREVVEGVASGLRALGHDAIIRSDFVADGRREIVIGGHLIEPARDPVAPDAVFYNLEQLTPDSLWFKDGRIELLRGRTVWDYSPANIAGLAALGIDAKLVPIGYAPEWTRIERSGEDIDVLFYGSTNHRHYDIIEAIDAVGASVYVATGVYGAERDALIARARIVLNIHYYEAQTFEIVRVSYLLANRKCVVSERGKDLALEAPLEQGVAFGSATELPALCRRYLDSRSARRDLAERGFDILRGMPMSESLRRVLG